MHIFWTGAAEGSVKLRRCGAMELPQETFLVDEGKKRSTAVIGYVAALTLFGCLTLGVIASFRKLLLLPGGLEASGRMIWLAVFGLLCLLWVFTVIAIIVRLIQRSRLFEAITGEVVVDEEFFRVGSIRIAMASLKSIQIYKGQLLIRCASSGKPNILGFPANWLSPDALARLNRLGSEIKGKTSK